MDYLNKRKNLILKGVILSFTMMFMLLLCSTNSKAFDGVMSLRQLADKMRTNTRRHFAK